MYVATNAPGRNAFNRVEANGPLSRELSGVILPHEHFGSHLNDKGETVDEKLEVANSVHAGSILAEIWNGMVIDKFPVKAVYVEPPCELWLLFIPCLHANSVEYNIFNFILYFQRIKLMMPLMMCQHCGN